jgi:APA family basic amino acid/polyamine antiporter
VFVFRARGKVSPFRTPGYPVTPIVFLALSLWTVYYGVKSHPTLTLEIGGVLVAGAVIYLATARGKDRLPIEADE